MTATQTSAHDLHARLVAVHCTHGEPVENWAVKECDKKKKGRTKYEQKLRGALPLLTQDTQARLEYIAIILIRKRY